MTIVADITNCPIAELAPDSSVVFVSCVLEYVPDLDAALTEIARIAGSGDNVFIVNVQPWTLTARLYPNATDPRLLPGSWSCSSRPRPPNAARDKRRWEAPITGHASSVQRMRNC